MKVQTFSGETVTLKLNNKRFDDNKPSRSLFQHSIGQQLTEQYPHDIVFEEVYIPGEGFVLDFFIPSLRLVVECNGRQHREHVKYFHRTRQEFHHQQHVDQNKRAWCELNDFLLVEIDDE